MKIRNTKISDIDKIFTLINNFSEQYSLLPVTKDFIFEHINNYYIVEYHHNLVGVGFLRIYNNNLAEIRSLAVDLNYQKKGFGKKLVCFLIKEAKKIGITRVFALSTTPEFFTKIGFKLVEKTTFPEKIWVDWQFCPNKEKCDESALLYAIES